MKYIVEYKKSNDSITKLIKLVGDDKNTKPVIIKWKVGSDTIKITQDGICINISKSQLKEINKFYHEFLFDFIDKE